MQLMRNRLQQLFPRVRDAHAGLLMQRGLTDWEEGEKPIKSKLIETISSVTPNELYLLAFERWLSMTHDDSPFDSVSLSATIEGRLYTGLPLGGTLETGASVHHTYGMPMISGSSIKGAVRSYTEHLFAKRDDKGELQFNKSDTVSNKSDTVNKLLVQEDRQDILDTLFGTDSDDVEETNAGYLIWHDAWWIPIVNDSSELLTGDKYKPFVDDIVTVHHQAYYNRDIAEALDMENPVPNKQLAIQGSFYFAIEGEKQWVALAKQLLEQTIQNVGLGSKTSSGYGYFKIDDKLTADIAKRYGSNIDVINTDDPLAIIRQAVKYLDSDQLIESLSKGMNKFFKDLGLDKSIDDDIKKVVQVVIEEHSVLVDAWENESAKNTKRAYKLVSKYKS